MERTKDLQRENRKENKQKKRKQEEIDSKRDEEDLLGDSYKHVPPDVLSAIQSICTCFGIGGLYNAKKRKIESKGGVLETLKEEWNPLDEIKALPFEMQQRYAKKISEESFKLSGLIKKNFFLFKKLHEGRSFMKDITMDVFLKDVKIKPSLAPPDQYVEMGLWRQVMQVNQQICQEMEQLDKKLEENDCQVNSEEDTPSKYAEKSEEKEPSMNESKDKTKSFRDYYMEMATSSFGDDLDRLRQEGSLDSQKVEMLINCLETGKDIWSDLEKKLLQST